jgi:2-haloacid dehalogenase
MVAAHGWDLMGAKRVGLTTAWVSRKEGRLLATVPKPDVTGDDLLAAADRIVELSRT